MTGMSKIARAAAYPLASFGLLIAAWAGAIAYLDIPNYLLPTPAAVAGALVDGYVGGRFWPHFASTAQVTMTGYAAGCGLALLSGVILAESTHLERLVSPYIVALQSMPKVALAPLIIVWFGFGMASKVVMVAMVCFFPLFVNTTVGIRQTNPALIDLMRAFGASRLSILLRVKLPSAVGHIFAGLQISIVMSLIGAVVSEFIASTRGLGYLIKAASINLEVDVMFAALVSLAAMGLAGSQFIRVLHRRLVFWDRGAAVLSE